ncbi:MAG: O-antigen ligase family protein [Lishizhenia sp.]
MKRALRLLVDKYFDLLFILFFAFAFFLPRYIPIAIALMFIGLLFPKHRKTRSELSFKFKGNEVLYAFVALYLLHVTFLLNSENIHFGLKDLEMKLVFILFPIFFFFSPNSITKKVFKYFSYVALINAIWLLFIFLFLPNQTEAGKILNSDIHRNYLAVYFTLAAVYFLLRSLTKKIALELLYCIVLIATSILTQSKIGLIISVLSVLLILIYTFFVLKNYKNGIVALISLSLFSLVVYITIPQAFNRVSNMVNVIKTKENVPFLDQDEKTGYIKPVETNKARMQVWESSVGLITQNPLGYGTGDVSDVLVAENKKNGYLYVAAQRLNSHNQFFTTTIALSFLGGVLLLSIFILTLFRNKISTQHSWFKFLILFSIFLFALTESCFEVQAGIIIFTLLIIALSRKNEILT